MTEAGEWREEAAAAAASSAATAKDSVESLTYKTQMSELKLIFYMEQQRRRRLDAAGGKEEEEAEEEGLILYDVKKDVYFLCAVQGGSGR